MGQIEQVSINVESLTTAIEELGEAIVVPAIPQPDIKQHILTKEEIMVKILMMGGIPVPGVPVTIPGMDEETAYETVYGEIQPSGATSGNLLYPGVVNREKSKINESHPMNEYIDTMEKEVSVAIKQLGSKSGEIIDASTQLGIEVAASVVTIASSAVVMPFGAGVPTGFSAVLSVFASLRSFQAIVQQILPFLQPLTKASLLLPEDKIETVLAPINMALTSLKSTIGTVQSTVGLISELKNSLLSPPGVEIPGGGGTPAEPIVLDISATESAIRKGRSTTLDVNASKGSWEYTYLWSIDDDKSFHSTDKTTNVSPNLTTTYTVTVTDSSGSVSTENITIIVESSSNKIKEGFSSSSNTNSNAVDNETNTPSESVDPDDPDKDEDGDPDNWGGDGGDGS